MAIQIQLRNDTAANWTANDPILAIGEMGLETDTDQFKIGDGVLNWSALPYGGLQGQAGTDGVGVPAGGTAGQVLSKIDGSDYNTQWTDSAGGGSSELMQVNVYNSTGSVITAGTVVHYVSGSGNGTNYIVEPWPTNGDGQQYQTQEILGVALADIPASFAGEGQVVIGGTMPISDQIITWNGFVYLNPGTGALQNSPAGNPTFNTPLGFATSGNGSARLTLAPWFTKQKLSDSPDISINYGTIQDGDVLSFNSSNYQFEFRTPSGGGGSTVNDNLLLNGGFEVWQEINDYASPVVVTKSAAAGNAYLADNWQCQQFGGSGNMTITRVALGSNEFGDATKTRYGLRTTVTPDAGGFQFKTFIEDVTTVSNEEVTISMWVKRSNGGYTVPIWEQNFGNGGSAAVQVFGSGAVLAADTWTLISETVTIPSVAGKTININNHLSMALNFQGLVSSEVVTVAQVKIERGNTASTFTTKYGNKSLELQACQRYLYVMKSETDTEYLTYNGHVRGAGGRAATFRLDFPVNMRTAPSAIWDTQDWSVYALNFDDTDGITTIWNAGSDWSTGVFMDRISTNGARWRLLSGSSSSSSFDENGALLVGKSSMTNNDSYILFDARY